ncbi:DotA/TraY family protein [Rhizobium sp. NFR12]|uniref:DotA/TraY family protein n=1 Tax=Rhizobium sp. NFR12 TaxID=1566261 RepID=UPI0008A7A038|nr:DotA/TraY family protein [Rhizobium sp. NFR12]SEH27897.1 conjugal transfer/type IV secretion protein DotA/TraY [Rhizobium sp. NFR12]
MMIYDLFAEPSATNLAWQWVNVILPSDMTSPWGRALSVFASTLTLIAVNIIAWTTIQGIVQSAYTGKVLGERFHQIWAPLRVVFGLGLIMPIAGGFSPIHEAIKQIVLRPAVNIADATWLAFVETVAKDGTPIVAASAGGSGLVFDLVEHEICLAVAKAAGEPWGYNIPSPATSGELHSGGLFSNPTVTWSYGRDCGSMSYTLPKDQPKFAETRRAAIAGLVMTLRVKAATYGSTFQDGKSIPTPEAAMNAVTQSILPAGLAADIRTAGAAYDKAISIAAAAEASKVESDSRSKLVEAAREQGWMNAGSYWRSLSQISELTVALATEKPERTAPRLDQLASFATPVRNALDTLRYQISGEQLQASLTSDDLAAAGDASADFLTKILGPMTRNLGDWLSSSPDASKTDPMGDIISGGHVMIAAAGSAIVAGGAVMVASSNWFADAMGAGGAASWLLDWSKLAIGALWLIGAMRAYVLPMIPFLFVMIAAITWAAAILEAMIASLLWGLAFLRMDNGDFIAQGQRQGLMLLFNVALRPVLAVLALCGAYLLFAVTVSTLNALWPTAFYGQTGGHIAGLSGLVVSLALQTFILWTVCIKLFGLIANLPDRVGTWLDVSSNAHYGEAGHVGGMAAGAVALASRGTPGAIPTKGLTKVGSGFDDGEGPNRASISKGKP